MSRAHCVSRRVAWSRLSVVKTKRDIRPWSMTELTSLQNDVFSLLRTVNLERVFPFFIFFSSCNEEASCASSARLFQAIFHAVSYCRTMKEEGFGEDITTVFYWLTTLCIRIKITRSSEKKVPIPRLFFFSLSFIESFCEPSTENRRYEENLIDFF